MLSSVVPVLMPFCEDAAVGTNVLGFSCVAQGQDGGGGQTLMQLVWGCLGTGLLGWEVFGS